MYRSDDGGTCDDTYRRGTTLLVLEFITTSVAGDEETDQYIDRKEVFGAYFAEITAWKVPTSDRYPDGVTYSFQYGKRGGETIFRYDNFPDHPNAPHHHKHTRNGDVIDVDFGGLESLYERFKKEVQDEGHDW